MARKASAKKATVKEKAVEPASPVTVPEVKKEVMPVEAKAEEPERKADIPETVDAVLKVYPNYRKLWVDQRGIKKFPEGTSKRLLEGCTLYENPYFNNQ